jgi:hypothetical protein
MRTHAICSSACDRDMEQWLVAAILGTPTVSVRPARHRQQCRPDVADLFSKRLAIAFVALPRLARGRRFSPAILRQRASDVVRLLEAP